MTNKPAKEPKGMECYWHEKGKLAGYRLGYENALKAQWQPFNPKDKSTRPKKEGAYLARFEDDFLALMNWDYETKDYWLETYKPITHYMKITPPGEDNG